MKLFIKNSQARKYYPEKKYFKFDSNFSKKGLLQLLYGVKKKNKSIDKYLKKINFNYHCIN